MPIENLLESFIFGRKESHSSRKESSLKVSSIVWSPTGQPTAEKAVQFFPKLPVGSHRPITKVLSVQTITFNITSFGNISETIRS